jgi:hypothetical protein
MRVAGIIAARLMVGLAAIAQQQPLGQPSQRGSSMNMGDMMKQCRAHCERTTAAINQSRKDIEATQQSNNPAKMRAALAAVDEQLTDMSQHMTMCTNMMGMMQHMQGMDMGSTGKKQ